MAPPAKQREKTAKQQRIDAKRSEPPVCAFIHHEAGQKMGCRGAQDRTDHDASEADADQPPAVFDPEDDPGPEEVELLLDTKGPEVPQEERDPGKGCTLDMHDADRLQVCAREKGIEKTEPVAEISRPGEKAPGPIPAEDGVENDKQQDHSVIERKDAQSAANVKVADAVRVAA